MKTAEEHQMVKRAENILRKYCDEGNWPDHSFDPTAMVSHLLADLMVLARHKSLNFDTILARAIKLSEP